MNARSGSMPRTATPSPSGGKDGERIAKVIARAGICSRRDAERLIEEGKVTVNGKKISSPALNVRATRHDHGRRQGAAAHGADEALALSQARRPRDHGEGPRRPHRPFSSGCPTDMPRVVTVGRLDINTEGLLLLTNDGELARLLELPATGWTRRYRVRAWGAITQAQLDKLKDGIEVEGVRYGPIEATLDKVQGSNVWLTVGLKEGKNREVKRVLAALDLTVNRLIRLSFGPFQVGDLAEGEVAQVPNRVLMDQLGTQAAQFNKADGGAEPVRHQDRNRSERPVAPKPASGKKPRAKNSGGASFIGHKRTDGHKKPETGKHAKAAALSGKPRGADKPRSGKAGAAPRKPEGEKAYSARNPDRSRHADGTRKFDKNHVPETKSGTPKGPAQKTRADLAKSRKPHSGKKPR